MKEQKKPNTVMYYLKYLLLFAIPGIGQIISICYIFSNKADADMKNFAKATLIYFLVIYLILSFGITFQIGKFICK